MLDLLLNPIVTHAAIGVVCLFLGVGLGRRSKRANAFYDQARAKYDETADKVRDKLDD